MVNLYGRFLAGAAKILKPLTDTLGGKLPQTAWLPWLPAMESAFVSIQEASAIVTMLSYPLPSARLALAVDSSDSPLGACL